MSFACVPKLTFESRVCFRGFVTELPKGEIVKLLFTTSCFVGLYFVPNLIVMLFNLLYPVSIVRFHCKGCVLERKRECEDSSN